MAEKEGDRKAAASSLRFGNLFLMFILPLFLVVTAVHDGLLAAGRPNPLTDSIYSLFLFFVIAFYLLAAATVYTLRYSLYGKELNRAVEEELQRHNEEWQVKLEQARQERESRRDQD